MAGKDLAGRHQGDLVTHRGSGFGDQARSEFRAELPPGAEHASVFRVLTVLAEWLKWPLEDKADVTNAATSAGRDNIVRFEAIQSVAISATDAKNEFGRILETVIQGGRVVITKHDSPKAVLISMDEFNVLSNAHRAELETLSEEFDGLLARMQTPSARAGMNAAFHATPKELGKAPVAAARKRA